MSRDYELALIINPEASEEETRTILDRVEQIVATHGGKVVRVNQWGRRRLAYPIERHRDGFYVFFDMILNPETVIELERTLKVSETVLRHMAKKRDSRVVQKEREEREARAAALANAAANAPEGQPAEEAPLPAEATSEEAPEQPEAVPVLAEEEMEDVPPAIEDDIPPAIEEETVEA
ncbi:MAG: 30S ribosomal protein S6 [Ktedonobacteraceae bacterium]|nr:30S ribosomal protein S6 [Ktedonobacteraceae bacterium]MBV9711663.1 30S ribosomal protein S6 [Ktedonobacteraceae bacterium]